MDFKKKVRNYEQENQRRELSELKDKHDNLNRYEKSFERTKKNFLSLLSDDNRRMTETHYKMQTIQNKTTKNDVSFNQTLGSIEHGKDLMNSLEIKNQKKQMLIRN